jgi:hypothetical protein
LGLIAAGRRHLRRVAEVRELRAVEHGQDRGQLGAHGGQVLSITFHSGDQALFRLGQQDMDHPRWRQPLGLIWSLERRRHLLTQGEVLGQAVARAS